MNIFSSIQNQIKDSLIKSYKITEKDILNSEYNINNSEMVLNSSKILLDEIKSNKIKYLVIETNIIEEDVINKIFNNFVIGLIDLEPSDYEGDEPLSIETMLNTTSLYIMEEIKKGKKGDLSEILIVNN